MDNHEQYTKAFVLYQEGLAILVDSIKGIKDIEKKKYLHTKAEEYFDRAEKIKALIDERKATGKYREQTKIEAGSSGHGYEGLFGRFLDDTVTHIHIEDPYIRAHHQVIFIVLSITSMDYLQ